MNIDEKLRNNWYLDQDDIQTLIKRYRIMKYVNYIFAVVIAVLLLSCDVTNDKPEYVYQVGDSIEEYQILTQQGSNQIYLITADGITLEKQSLLHGRIDAVYGEVGNYYRLYSGDIQKELLITVHYKTDSMDKVKELASQ